MIAEHERQLLEEKLVQAQHILNECDLDLWMLVASESDVMGDPTFPLVVGTSVTWPSAFLLTRHGDRIALVGTGDVENVRQLGTWHRVIGYVERFGQPLRDLLDELHPQTIGVNYSKDNPLADGIPHGFFLYLQDILADTPYWERVISAEPVVMRLRSRKSPEELRRMRQAVATTCEIWQTLHAWLRPGLSERDIAAFLHAEVQRRGLMTAWDARYCPTVTAGPNSPIGHTGPTDIVLEPGQLLAIDFGVRQDGYCSDMQRTFYVLAPGESVPPQPVQEAFELVAQTIAQAAAALRPGVAGWEVDQVARECFARAGVEPWAFALGHQVGRAVHDGGCLLGPRWERYGQQPFYTVEPGHVYTLELGLSVPGYGRVSLEEEVLVTETGCEFLAPPQRELLLVPSAHA